MRLRFVVYPVLAFVLLAVLALQAFAHEVRPAFLKITETQPGEFSVIWKQPVVAGKRLRIKPQFPEGCNASEPVQSRNAGTVSDVINLTCALDEGIIRLDGLERTLTDAFVEINRLEGGAERRLLKPSNPQFELSSESESTAAQYLRIGVDHIIFGWDHLFFVIGLALLVRGRQIWAVATAFTLAHSLTLGAAALGFLNVPTRPVEILIALSIVLLGVEIMRKFAGHDSLAVRRPYLISFLIGLIHGCGFASALADIGLPKGTELLALFLFNIGVELGQFGVIALFLLFMAVLTKMSLKARRPIELAVTYSISAVAMFWVLDRLSQYWV